MYNAQLRNISLCYPTNSFTFLAPIYVLMLSFLILSVSIQLATWRQQMSKQKFRTLKFQHLYRTDYSTTLIHFLSMTSTAFTAYKKIRNDKELKKKGGNMAVGAVLHPRAGGEGLPGCKLPLPTNRNLRNADFVDMTTSKVLHVSLFCQIIHWNRLMSGTFEFRKIQLKIYDVVHKTTTKTKTKKKTKDQTLSFKSDEWS